MVVRGAPRCAAMRLGAPTVPTRTPAGMMAHRQTINGTVLTFTALHDQVDAIGVLERVQEMHDALLAGLTAQCTHRVNLSFKLVQVLIGHLRLVVSLDDHCLATAHQTFVHR
jgi:hypothetical protein